MVLDWVANENKLNKSETKRKPSARVCLNTADQP